MQTNKATVVCSMRNEGPFLVEWVAWYRWLGFTDLVIVTNNCTDHSPELLDALETAGWVHHVRHDVAPGLKITDRKLDAVKAHPAVEGADWVMVCDVDEFLVIHVGEGRLPDLIAPHVGPDGEARILGMSINWRVFGTSGRTRFEDVPVHRQFLKACGPDHPLSRNVKSIFRCPDWFEKLRPHGPRGLVLARADRAWGQPGMQWIMADGRPLEEWQPDGEYLRRVGQDLVGFGVAQMNHYMLRSVETFTLKAGTPSPAALKDRYTQRYFDRANQGDQFDDSALRHGGAWEAVFREAMSLPEVARLHDLCCEDHRRMIALRRA
ncbi:MAG TPA: glycosyltransferase family 2 protein [Tabrizicola sp.]|nr:glycosyltransferase family 2 protein [Tabrizicola sp.]